VKSFPLRAVVDASVAVKIFVPENLSVHAQDVFLRFAREDEAELIVPDFFFIECANVFWKWVQRSHYPLQDAKAHLNDLAGLGLTTVSAQILAGDALNLSFQYRITAYDACYLAAANRLQLPLITADKKLVDRLGETFDNLRWLGGEGQMSN
jgi:predicted nucleic acid-binding protein